MSKKEKYVKDENFVSIQGWMRTNAELKGNDLIIYAIIYGFSQTKNQYFTGSLNYLMQWTGATENTVIASLKRLQKKGLIVKKSFLENGQIFNRYSAIVPDLKSKEEAKQPSSKIEEGSIFEESSKIEDNNKNNNITLTSNIILSKKDTPEEKPKRKTQKRRDSYDDILAAEIESPEVRAALIEYIKARKMQKKSLTNYALKKLIKDLKTMSIDPVEQIKIIDAATVNGWGCFYPSKAAEKQNTKKNDFKKFNQRDYSKEQTAALEAKLLGG